MYSPKSQRVILMRIVEIMVPGTRRQEKDVAKKLSEWMVLRQRLGTVFGEKVGRRMVVTVMT